MCVIGPMLSFMSLCFSPDGDNLLLTTDSNQVLLLDSFTGSLKHTFTTRGSESKLSSQACFSPDGKYVLSGTENGGIHVWDAVDGTRVNTLKGHAQAVSVVRWSPTKLLVASASSKLALWIPDLSRLGQNVINSNSSSLSSSSSSSSSSSR